MNKPNYRKSFHRLVLLPEDMYQKALGCLAKEAFEAASEKTVWYEKDSESGKLQKFTAPGESQTQASQAVPVIQDSTEFDPNVATIDNAPNNMELYPLETTSEPTTQLINDEMSAGKSVAASKYKPINGNRKGIPTTFRKKYDLLLSKLKSMNRYQVDSRNQLVLPTGRVLEGSNFHELLRYMFNNSNANSNTRPIGFDTFVSDLRSEGVSPSEVTSKVVKLALGNGTGTEQFGKGVRPARTHPPGKRVKVLRVY
jgi:hypothetical protein